MLDALPYLIDYPYGCTEQTMSRFLPAVITAKTLRDLGLKPGDVMGRVFGGIETNSAAATHPKGKKDLEELDRIEKASLERLYDFQHADGGWGWWKEGDSDHWMTAYVVWGLSLARPGWRRSEPLFGARCRFWTRAWLKRNRIPTCRRGCCTHWPRIFTAQKPASPRHSRPRRLKTFGKIANNSMPAPALCWP